MILDTWGKVSYPFIAHVVPFEEGAARTNRPSRSPAVVIKIPETLVRDSDKFEGIPRSQEQVITKSGIPPHGSIITMSIPVLNTRVVDHKETGRVIVHFYGDALKVEEFVSEDICRPAANGLDADTHSGVIDAIAPHADIGLVVIDLDAVVDAEGNIIPIDVVTIGSTREGLKGNAITEVPDLIVTDDVPPTAQVDTALGRDAAAWP